MPKGTITIPFSALTQMLRQVVFLSEFEVVGAWVGCDRIEVQIQGEDIQSGLSVTAAVFIPDTWVEPPQGPQGADDSTMAEGTSSEPIVDSEPAQTDSEAVGEDAATTSRGRGRQRSGRPRS